MKCTKINLWESFFIAKGFVTYYCSASLLSSIFMRRLSDIWPSDCENAKMTFAGLDLANKLLCISFAYVLQWSLHHFIHCAICQKFQSNVDFFVKLLRKKVCCELQMTTSQLTSLNIYATPQLAVYWITSMQNYQLRNFSKISTNYEKLSFVSGKKIRINHMVPVRLKNPSE